MWFYIKEKMCTDPEEESRLSKSNGPTDGFTFQFLFHTKRIRVCRVARNSSHSGSRYELFVVFSGCAWRVLLNSCTDSASAFLWSELHLSICLSFSVTLCVSLAGDRVISVSCLSFKGKVNSFFSQTEEKEKNELRQNSRFFPFFENRKGREIWLFHLYWKTHMTIRRLGRLVG